MDLHRAQTRGINAEESKPDLFFIVPESISGPTGLSDMGHGMDLDRVIVDYTKSLNVTKAE